MGQVVKRRVGRHCGRCRVPPPAGACARWLGAWRHPLLRRGDAVWAGRGAHQADSQ